ncbi:hypothetical protein M5K25_027655 [Dendrobium thyrsiflorum]|uniref:Uncharacterized protein n=1 Tax=Dendrobium thyrsiflorum TaxID=117978 RepID=A0ABD0TUD1_DENTH
MELQTPLQLSLSDLHKPSSHTEPPAEPNTTSIYHLRLHCVELLLTPLELHKNPDLASQLPDLSNHSLTPLYSHRFA